MSAVVILLTRPFRMFRQVFFSDVKLKREGRNLNVKLVQKEGAPSMQQGRASPSKEQQDLDAMRLALKILLDSHPSTRRVMRHLVFFETALGATGLKVVREVPLEVLTEALKQFELIVTNWSSRNLSDLRSKMAVAVVERSKDPFYGSGGEKVSDFNTDSRLQVDDVSHSMFMEIANEYHGRVPGRVNEIDQIDVEDFAPTQPFDREEFHLLSKDAAFGIPGVPDFAPTQAFDHGHGEMKIQLMPIT